MIVVIQNPGYWNPKPLYLFMNYKELLTKFIEHVRLNSGDTYIGSIYKDDKRFTKEEWRELREIIKSMESSK